MKRRDLPIPVLAHEHGQLNKRLTETQEAAKEHQQQVAQLHNRIRYLQHEESRAMKKMSDSQKRTLVA